MTDHWRVAILGAGAGGTFDVPYTTEQQVEFASSRRDALQHRWARCGAGGYGPSM